MNLTMRLTFSEAISWLFDQIRLVTYFQAKQLGFGHLYNTRKLANGKFIFNYCFYFKNMFSTFFIGLRLFSKLILEINYGSSLIEVSECAAKYLHTQK